MASRTLSYAPTGSGIFWTDMAMRLGYRHLKRPPKAIQRPYIRGAVLAVVRVATEELGNTATEQLARRPATCDGHSE